MMTNRDREGHIPNRKIVLCQYVSLLKSPNCGALNIKCFTVFDISHHIVFVCMTHFLGESLITLRYLINLLQTCH